MSGVDNSPSTAESLEERIKAWWSNVGPEAVFLARTVRKEHFPDATLNEVRRALSDLVSAGFLAHTKTNRLDFYRRAVSRFRPAGRRRG